MGLVPSKFSRHNLNARCAMVTLSDPFASSGMTTKADIRPTPRCEPASNMLLAKPIVLHCCTVCLALNAHPIKAPCVSRETWWSAQPDSETAFLPLQSGLLSKSSNEAEWQQSLFKETSGHNLRGCSLSLSPYSKGE
eukprot:2433901-Amphidinium_carterae.1